MPEIASLETEPILRVRSEGTCQQLADGVGKGEFEVLDMDGDLPCRSEQHVTELSVAGSDHARFAGRPPTDACLHRKQFCICALPR
jgi:hypothetical protein